MARRVRTIEVPGYFRLIIIAGLIGALLMLHLSEKEA